MDPVADPTPPAAPPAPALAKGDPDGGVASAVAAPPDPPPPPRFPWLARLSPRARSVLRVLLATLALGWCTQYAMRRHFDAGPYTGPLYLYYPDGTTNTPGLMDDTGRIVVPAGEYRYLMPIGGWHSAWIGVGTRRFLAWSTRKPYLSLGSVLGTPVIVQAGAASRPLGVELPSVPLVARRGIDRDVKPGAYRLARYPELLELYRDPRRGTYKSDYSHVLKGVRMTEGPTLLRGARVFRLSQTPPIYMVWDDGQATIHRWEGGRFVKQARFPCPEPYWVCVLGLSPLTMLMLENEAIVGQETGAPLNPAGNLCIYRMAGDRVETLGRYLNVSPRYHGRKLPSTEQLSEIHRIRHPGFGLDYLEAQKAAPGSPDGIRLVLLSPEGVALAEGDQNVRFDITEHWINVKSAYRRDGKLVERTTGYIYPYRNIRWNSRRTMLLELHDGSEHVIDSQGAVMNSIPPPTYSTSVPFGWERKPKAPPPEPSRTERKFDFDDSNDPLRGFTVRRTDQALRVYDHADRLLFEQPGDWSLYVHRFAWDLFALYPTQRLPGGPIRYLVHADGSPAPDDGKGKLSWLDGTVVTIGDPAEQYGPVRLRTADQMQLLGGSRVAYAHRDKNTTLINLTLLSPSGDMKIGDYEYRYRLYNAATDAISPAHRGDGSTHFMAGRLYVDMIADGRPWPRVKALLGDDLQPFPAFLESEFEHLVPVGASVDSTFSRDFIATSPTSGSWASVNLLLGGGGWRELWQVLNVDGQPIAPVTGKTPTLVDSRFLRLHTKTGTVLIDRFGHTVTPHE